jgi:hypothetical protein
MSPRKRARKQQFNGIVVLQLIQSFLCCAAEEHNATKLYITQSEPATSNADPSAPVTPAQAISHLSHLANVSSLFASSPTSATVAASMQKLRGEQRRTSESETEEVRVCATRTSTHTLFVQARTTSNSESTLPNMELTCVTGDIKHTTSKRQRRLSHSPEISFARPLNFSPPDEVEKKENGRLNVSRTINCVLPSRISPASTPACRLLTAG